MKKMWVDYPDHIVYKTKARSLNDNCAGCYDKRLETKEELIA